MNTAKVTGDRETEFLELTLGPAAADQKLGFSK
jgi:hypothetical protein